LRSSPFCSQAWALRCTAARELAYLPLLRATICICLRCWQLLPNPPLRIHRCVHPVDHGGERRSSLGSKYTIGCAVHDPVSREGLPFARVVHDVHAGYKWHHHCRSAGHRGHCGRSHPPLAGSHREDASVHQLHCPDVGLGARRLHSCVATVDRGGARRDGARGHHNVLDDGLISPWASSMRVAALLPHSMKHFIARLRMSQWCTQESYPPRHCTSLIEACICTCAGHCGNAVFNAVSAISDVRAVSAVRSVR